MAGSLRRLRETVGDLDFIVASADPQPVMDWFVTQPAVAEVTAHGATKSSVRFEGGLQADLRVVPAEQFAFVGKNQNAARSCGEDVAVFVDLQTISATRMNAVVF